MGEVSGEEFKYLIEYVRQFSCHSYLEIGSHSGVTMKQVGEELRPKFLYSFDEGTSLSHRALFKVHTKHLNVTSIKGYRRFNNTETFLKHMVKDIKFDFIFINCDSRKIRHDFSTALSLAKSGAVIGINNTLKSDAIRDFMKSLKYTYGASFEITLCEKESGIGVIKCK